MQVPEVSTIRAKVARARQASCRCVAHGYSSVWFGQRLVSRTPAIHPCWHTSHLPRILLSMFDPSSRLNAALEGRYRIEPELGEGGMANVYPGDDVRHRRPPNGGHGARSVRPSLDHGFGATTLLRRERDR